MSKNDHADCLDCCACWEGMGTCFNCQVVSTPP